MKIQYSLFLSLALCRVLYLHYFAEFEFNVIKTYVYFGKKIIKKYLKKDYRLKFVSNTCEGFHQGVKI